MQKEDSILRNRLLLLIHDRNAHATFEDAVAGIPVEIINNKVEGFEHSLYELLEHLRIAQWDILDFMRNPDYKERSWPQDYWPEPGFEASARDWHHSLNLFRNDLKEIEAIIKNPQTDFFAPIGHAPNYTVFREILLVADHNAYHVGQMVMLRRQLGIWKK